MKIRHLLWLVVLGTGLPLSAQVELRVGNLVLAESGHPDPFCIQVPVYLRDVSDTGRLFTSLTFTLSITGDTGILNGTVADDMLVCGGFTDLEGGIFAPAVDLENADPMSDPTPMCGTIVNQATKGYDPVEWVPPLSADPLWFINNNEQDLGYKKGFMLDLTFNGAGASVQGEDLMIAVLEIPLIADPGAAELVISAVPNAEVSDANVFSYMDTEGNSFDEDFDIASSDGVVRICPQTFASRPDDVAACPGDTVDFSVQVTGSGPFSYQWNRDGMPLLGKTGSTLTLAAVSPDDVAAYTCTVGSACTVLESPAGLLTLNPFTAGVNPPGAALGLNAPGFEAVLDCAAPEPLYAWRDAMGVLVGEAAQFSPDPVPTTNSSYTLTVTDGLDRSQEQTVHLLVHPLGPDLNGDGFNTFEDLYLVLPQWRGAAFDADGDNVLTVRDMLYINVGP